MFLYEEHWIFRLLHQLSELKWSVWITLSIRTAKQLREQFKLNRSWISQTLSPRPTLTSPLVRDWNMEFGCPIKINTSWWWVTKCTKLWNHITTEKLSIIQGNVWGHLSMKPRAIGVSQNLSFAIKTDPSVVVSRKRLQQYSKKKNDIYSRAARCLIKIHSCH